MTTIVSNGHYLVADHRMCLSLSRPAPVFMQNKGNETQVENKLQNFSDSASKILFLDYELKVGWGFHTDSKIKAFGISGSLEDGVKLLAKMKDYKTLAGEAATLSVFIDLMHSFEVKFDCSLLGVTHLGETVYSLNTSTFQRKSGTLDPGIVYGIGSGWSAIDDVPFDKSNWDAHKAFKACSLFDPNTSPSYAVFGAKENMFYPYVLEPEEVRKEWIIEIMRDFKNNKATAGAPHYKRNDF